MDRIGKYTAKLLEVLEDRRLTQPHFHIIVHPSVYDKHDSQKDLDKLKNRGLVYVESSVEGDPVYTLSPKGQHVLEDYRKWKK